MLKLVQKMSLLNNCTISSIEGNIACGKSTILDFISSKNSSKIYCAQEPVNEWTNMDNGTDLLKLFYLENERWSFTFENTVQLSRLKSFYDAKKYIEQINLNKSPLKSSSTLNSNVKKDYTKQKIFLERSIFSSFNVFAMNSFEENRLTQVEFDILQKYYEFFLKESFKHVNKINEIANNSHVEDESENDMLKFQSSTNTSDKKCSLPFRIIYVRTSPEICFERLKKRERSAELSIGLDYLTKIHNKYEKWILTLKETQVRIINGNESKERVLCQIEDVLNE